QFYIRQTPYNRPVGIRLSGTLNVSVLEQSLAALASRHEALRVVFQSESEDPAQYICEQKGIALTVLDFSNVPVGERAGRAAERAIQESRRPYVSSHPVLRPLLFRLSETDHWLVLVLHELVVDTRSIQVLLKDLASFYQKFSEGKTPSLPISSV